MPFPGRKTWSLIALLLLASLACESPTPVAPAESGLTISANPARITTADGTSDITVIARKSDGAAVNEGTEINLSTNLGSIDPTLAITDDRGVATAVLTGDGRVGLATVEASSGAAAAVALDVQIGSQPVVLTLDANPTRVPKDGGEVSLVATVSDDLGNGIENTRVTFTSSAGTLDSGSRAVLTDSGGSAETTLTLTAFDAGGVADGLFLVGAETVGADGAALTDELEIEVGGFVSTIILSTAPGTVPLSGADVNLTATVLDDIGDIVPDVGVFFGSDVGSTASGGRQVFTDSAGVATDVLTVTALDLEALPIAQTSFTATASAPGLNADLVEGTSNVAISTAVGTLILQAIPQSIDCETPDSLLLEATVFDDTGAPADGIAVNFGFNSTITPGVVEPTTVFANSEGIALSALTVDLDDLPCTDMVGTVITSFTVRADVILLGQPVESVIAISVNLP